MRRAAEERYQGTWPQDGRALLGELADFPGRLALVRNGDGVRDALDALAAVTEQPVVCVGRLLTPSASPCSREEVMSALLPGAVLEGLDILFWRPGLNLDPVQTLIAIARRHPLVAVWPGEIQASIARYGLPGRRDYFEAVVRDALILTPQMRRFPDQVPYTLERIPA